MDKNIVKELGKETLIKIILRLYETSKNDYAYYQKKRKELEEKRRKQEIQKQKYSVFQDKVNQQKSMINAKKSTSAEPKQPDSESTKMSVKEQMELLQQIKNLLDVGVLTQEKFDKKKQEIKKNSNKKQK